jgi:hypothetical protein
MAEQHPGDGGAPACGSLRDGGKVAGDIPGEQVRLIGLPEALGSRCKQIAGPDLNAPSAVRRVQP